MGIWTDLENCNLFAKLFYPSGSRQAVPTWIQGVPVVVLSLLLLPEDVMSAHVK